MTNKNFSGQDLTGANFNCANLSNADFSLGNLIGTNFSGANLIGADFRGAHLKDANFSGANLENVNFKNAYLRDTNLSGANLIGADFRGALLVGVNLKDVNFKGANFEYILYAATVIDNLYISQESRDFIDKMKAEGYKYIIYSKNKGYGFFALEFMVANEIFDGIKNRLLTEIDKNYHNLFDEFLGLYYHGKHHYPNNQYAFKKN